MQENLPWVFANNKGADQPAHPCSLISPIIIPFILESIISNHAICEFSIFLASLCSLGNWFESRFVGNPKDRFCHAKAQIYTITSYTSSISFILIKLCQIYSF